MAKMEGIEVSIAVAEAVKLANADVVAAYPITPQTHIVEHLAELVNDGELAASYIPVESEHSAMSACLGSFRHAYAHSDGDSEPGFISTDKYLGRPFGRDGDSRYRVDTNIC
jgi:pyruvate/2-oxoacid:ferredoxin oxidoreductase alpha subunit